jgi:hypothetical protein
VCLYFIPTAYIVGGIGATVYNLSDVEYYFPMRQHSNITVDPTFIFNSLPLSSSNSGYQVFSPGSSSSDTTAWRQVLVDKIINVGFVCRCFS